MDAQHDRDVMEIYKLHADLADRSSHRRLITNRMYVGLLAGLVAFVGALLRLGDGQGRTGPVMLMVGILGALLAWSWKLNIRSYAQLSDGKFKTLHHLEERLPFQFFKREWELLEMGENRSRYRELNEVEQRMALVFLCGFMVLGIIGSLIWLGWL